MKVLVVDDEPGLAHALAITLRASGWEVATASDGASALRAAAAHAPDVLLLDLPPGTGDVAISVAQLVPNAEILVVTTPQIAAAEIAETTAQRRADHLSLVLMGLAQMGGAQAILATPVAAAPTAALLPGLAPGGRLVLLGVVRERIALTVVFLDIVLYSVGGVEIGRAHV